MSKSSLLGFTWAYDVIVQTGSSHPCPAATTIPPPFFLPSSSSSHASPPIVDDASSDSGWYLISAQRRVGRHWLKELVSVTRRALRFVDGSLQPARRLKTSQ